MQAHVSHDFMADVAALEDRGIAVVPVAGKTPTIGWSTRRLPDREGRAAAFGSPCITGAAVVTGAVSGGLAVADFDSMMAYETWSEQQPTLSRELPTVWTPRGRHVYFRSDLQANRRMSVPGEYRGNGITVTPRSLHPSGKQYEWIRPLPNGELPFVAHTVFAKCKSVARNVAENAECHFSAVSAFSATSPDLIIRDTQPLHAGERNSRILGLARGLKFNAGMEKADKAALKSIVRQWHAMALPVIATKEFDQTWCDFLHGFERAKYPLGANAVDLAASTIDPDDLPAIAAQYESFGIRQLIGLCAALGAANAGHFFLSSHDAAGRLKVSSVQAWRWLNMLCADGVMVLEEKGNKFRASRYRWIGGAE